MKLLCRWDWHRWSPWAMPPGWRLLDKRSCGRCGVEQYRDPDTGRIHYQAKRLPARKVSQVLSMGGRAR